MNMKITNKNYKPAVAYVVRISNNRFNATEFMKIFYSPSPVEKIKQMEKINFKMRNGKLQCS